MNATYATSSTRLQDTHLEALARKRASAKLGW